MNCILQILELSTWTRGRWYLKCPRLSTIGRWWSKKGKIWSTYGGHNQMIFTQINDYDSLDCPRGTTGVSLLSGLLYRQLAKSITQLQTGKKAVNKSKRYRTCSMLSFQFFYLWVIQLLEFPATQISKTGCKVGQSLLCITNTTQNEGSRICFHM